MLILLSLQNTSPSFFPQNVYSQFPQNAHSSLSPSEAHSAPPPLHPHHHKKKGVEREHISKILHFDIQ